FVRLCNSTRTATLWNTAQEREKRNRRTLSSALMQCLHPPLLLHRVPNDPICCTYNCPVYCKKCMYSRRCRVVSCPLLAILRSPPTPSHLLELAIFIGIDCSNGCLLRGFVIILKDA
ncbi:unnamed protein product, partial [Ascophyllum nodosum]